MSEENISGQFGQFIPTQTQPFQTPSIDTIDEKTTTIQKPSTEDTIATSEVAGLLYLIYLANVPTLTPPADDYKTFSMAIELKLDKIKSDILDSWNKSLQEEAERIREELQSPRYRTWLEQHSPAYQANIEHQTVVKLGADFQSFLNSLAPIDRNEEMRLKQEYMLRIGLINGIENYKQSVNSGSISAAESLPFVAAIFVIGSTFISQLSSPHPVLPAEISTPVIGTSVPVATLNPQLQFMQEVMGSYMTMIPCDCRAELGLIGSLFSIGALYTSSLAAVGAGKPGDPKFLSEKYAEKIFQLIQSGLMNGFIQAAIIDKMEGSSKMSEARKAQMTAIVNVILIATAIGALVAAETKWMTGIDFNQLREGKFKPLNEHEKVVKEWLDKLLPLLERELNQLGSHKGQMEDALFEYFDKRRSYESFFDIEDAVKSISQASAFQPVGEI